MALVVRIVFSVVGTHPNTIRTDISGGGVAFGTNFLTVASDTARGALSNASSIKLPSEVRTWSPILGRTMCVSAS
eukprot:6397439-Amphidinium_carterae.1